MSEEIRQQDIVILIPDFKCMGPRFRKSDIKAISNISR